MVDPTPPSGADASPPPPPPTLLAYRNPHLSRHALTPFDRLCARCAIAAVGLSWLAIVLFIGPGRSDGDSVGLVRAGTLVGLIGSLAAGWFTWAARARPAAVVLLVVSVLTFLACLLQPVLVR